MESQILEPSYCVKDKDYTETLSPEVSLTRNGRYVMKAICGRCGKRKTKFLPASVGVRFF